FRGLVKELLRDLGPVAKGAVPELIRLLKEQQARDPEMVIDILGAIGPEAKDAVPLLIGLLEKRKYPDSCILALCNIGPAAKDAIPAVRLAARDMIAARKERDIPQYVLDELHKLGPDVVPFLLEMLDAPDTRDKQRSGSFSSWQCAFQSLL